MTDRTPYAHTRIQAAAAVVLLRDGAHGVELFLAKRHSAMDFMPEQYVFPGGKLEPYETVRDAAVRELYEEAGVLIGGKTAAHGAELRAEIEADHRVFRQHFGEAFLRDAAAQLTPWTRWLTPSGQKRRFDTRFFLATLPDGQRAWDANDESTHGVWLAPQSAITAQTQGKVQLPIPQLMTCIALKDSGPADCQSVLEYARNLPGTDERIIPVQDKRSDSLLCLLPWNKDYFLQGKGEMSSVSANHHLRQMPSRMAREGGIWKC